MKKVTSINPSTEEVFFELNESGIFEINAIVKKARNSNKWSEKNSYERAKVLINLVELLEENKKELAEIMAKEMGKAIKSGRHEVDITKKRISDFCRLIPGYIKEEILEENDKEINIARYEPLGVVAVISPWNAPIFVSLASIIPALLTGNNVIWKPSEYVSLTSIKLAEIIKKLALPENTFQYIIGGKDVGRSLVESDVDIIVLTGSVGAGREVIRSSAEGLKKFILELGGKDPAIVLKDANIKEAAAAIVKSATMYTGQVCFAVERVYCLSDVYDEFVERCLEEVKKIKVGNPMDNESDMGPFAVKFQMEKYFEHLEDALNKGAKILYGGKRIGNKGYFAEPSIITEVNHNMKIMKEETFSPCLPIMRIYNDEEAIRLANDSEYGLTASIWTSNLEKGKKIAEKIEAGTVEINRHGMSKAGCPWGGYKKSGIGRIYSKEGVREFTNVKHIWVVKN